MGKSLSSDSARAGSQKQQKEASRRAAPDARERIPAGAGGAARSYHFYGAYQRINSNQKQRPSRQSFSRTLLGQEWVCSCLSRNRQAATRATIPIAPNSTAIPKTAHPPAWEVAPSGSIDL